MAHVTVPDVATRIAYTVGGTPQSAFTIPFAYFDPTDIVVYVGGVLKTYSTDFSVSGVAVDGGYSGGTVTLTVAVSNTTVVVQRDTPTARTEDFPYPSSTINIKALNTALDKIAAWAQQLKAKASRALRQPDSDAADIGALPAKATRASTLLGFDANGDPVATVSAGGLTLPLAVAQGGTGVTTIDAAAAALNNTPTSRAPSLQDRHAFYSSTALTGGSALVSLLLALLAPAPCGRPTLTAGTPVQTATVSGGTTVRWTPYNGDRILVWNGTSWVITTFAETVLTLNNPNHAANTLYDMFWAEDPGTPGTYVLGTGPAWSSSTAGSSSRGTGAGTTELTRLNGLRVNAVQITLRNGATTYTIAANRATYLGTIYTGASAGTIDFSLGGIGASGTAARIALWTGNPANRRVYRGTIADTTDTWSYATATVRAANASNTMRCTAISGEAEDYARALYSINFIGDTTRNASAGIGFNSTSAFTGWRVSSTCNAIVLAQTQGGAAVQIFGVGFLQAVEIGAGAGTQTWYGDNGGAASPSVQAGMEYEVWA